MSDFVNPSTLALVPSANDMPPPWVVCTRLQLEAWSAIPAQYRKWVVDHIEEMTAAEKIAADAAALIAQRDAATAQVDNTEDVLRAVVLTLLDELNLHATKMKAILDAIDSSTTYATLKTNIAAVTDYPQRTVAQLRTAIRAKLGT